nr:hypothetical protein [uncultured Acetatifactor sp.]
MKKVFYVGFYDGDLCSPRRKSESNIAGTVYMRGLIDSLKRTGYHVTVVSLSRAAGGGIYRREHIVADDREEQFFLPYAAVRLGARTAGGRTVFRALKKFIRDKVGAEDIVISYHSLAYGDLLTKLHRRIGFTWIPEINEIYCLSIQDRLDASLLEQELKLFEEGDGYLFASDALAERYSRGRPFAVLYGNYRIVSKGKEAPKGNVNIAYTGIINEDRGVYRIIAAMDMLPAEYNLFILGFGSSEQLQKLKGCLEDANQKLGRERVFYCGTRTGKAYSEFLKDKHIGVNLISQQQGIADNAFPGKILSYMGHSLYVLSSACDSIVSSRLGKGIYFCENTPESIAETIKRIPVYEKCDYTNLLGGLQQEFEGELKEMLSAF